MNEITDRNRRAINDGLKEVNKRINDLTNRCVALERTNTLLMQDIQKLKQEKLADLCKKFGSGPTSI